jgi:hypothetical protein
MTFDEWWEKAEKPFGEARSFKDAARAGWKARQQVDVQVCLDTDPPLSSDAAPEAFAAAVRAAE